MLHPTPSATLAKVRGYQTGLGHTVKELLLAGNSFEEGAGCKLLHPVRTSVAALQLERSSSV